MKHTLVVQKMLSMKYVLLLTTLFTYNQIILPSHHAQPNTTQPTPPTYQELLKQHAHHSFEQKIKNLTEEVNKLKAANTRMEELYNQKSWWKFSMRNVKCFFWGTSVGAALTVFAGYKYFQEKGNLDFSMNLKFFKP